MHREAALEWCERACSRDARSGAIILQIQLWIYLIFVDTAHRNNGVLFRENNLINIKKNQFYNLILL